MSFFTPKEALEAEVSALSAQVNAALAGGSRAITVPTRVGRPLADALGARGWTVAVVSADKPDETLIVLSDPSGGTAS